ncbi:unnamed protein product, partial [Oncorhynchus mykiss]
MFSLSPISICSRQLLAPGYQEIWYSPSGSRQTSNPPSTGHCFYHGDVRGVEGSSAALSTCSGLRYAGQCVSRSFGFHVKLLKLQQHQGWSLEVGIQPCCCFLSGFTEAFQKHGADLNRTKTKLLEAANYVDKYYKSLSIRVAVIGLEVWSDQDRISVSGNPYSTLGAYTHYLTTTLNSSRAWRFRAPPLGWPLSEPCAQRGINSDHSDSAVGVAATMAHEMGHNFGMSHDSPGCCQAKADDGGCIMAAATGHPFPRVFNGCNHRELSRYLSSGGGKCLFNLPNTRAMYGGQRCGNGYLEDGEECDCGDEKECSSPCCNANNCTLKAGAECAHGVCCHNCMVLYT